MNRDDKKTSELAAIRDELPKFAPLVKDDPSEDYENVQSDDQGGAPADEAGPARWSPDLDDLSKSEPEETQKKEAAFVPIIDLEMHEDDAGEDDAGA